LSLGLECEQKAHCESDDVKFCSHMLGLSLGVFHSVRAVNPIFVKDSRLSPQMDTQRPVICNMGSGSRAPCTTILADARSIS
jgi:hypothetical protein